MMRVLTALFVILLPAVRPAAAQEPLTLADAIERALARNRDIAVERETVVQADTGLDRAESPYDPVFRLDARYRDQSAPVVSILSGAPEGELAPTSRGAGATASYQQFLRSGTSITFSSSISRETSNSFLTLVSPAWFTAVGVDVRHPLLQGRRFDPARRGLRIARITRERSDASLQRIVSETTAAVEQAYWALVAATADVEIRRTSVALAERQRDDVQARIEGKVTPESDAAQPAAEIARRQSDLFAAMETRARAEHALKALMLESADAALWSVEIRPTDRPEVPRAPVDLAAALADARRSRPELADVDARVKLQDVEIDAARDRLRPQLDLVGSYTARGLAGEQHDGVRAFPGLPLSYPDDLRGSLGSSLDNLARHRFPDLTAGITLTIPLGHRAARADLASAESGKRQATTIRERLELQITLEVRNAVVALDTAARRIDAARAARAAADVQLQAEQDRYAAGATTTFFVFTRQNELVAAQAAEVAALAAYRRALAELSRARGTLLADRGIAWPVR